MNAWVPIEGCATLTPIVVQQKTQTLYYVATAGQLIFPFGAPDMFGNSTTISDGVSLTVTKGGLRLVPDNGSSVGGYTVDVGGNAINLVWPAGVGEILVIDFFSTPADPAA